MTTQAETLEWSETKRKLVDAGVGLMRVNGFNATTVDDICQAAEVTKGAFFHYFKSKEDIAKAAMQRFSEGKAHDSQTAPYRQLTDPLARVFGRLDFAKESFGGTQHFTKGCLIGTFAQELSFTHPTLRSVCQDAFLRMASDFEKDLTAAKSAGTPDADFDPRKLALLYVSILQGSTLLAKTAESNAILLDNLEEFRRYLQFLFHARA